MKTNILFATIVSLLSACILQADNDDWNSLSSQFIVNLQKQQVDPDNSNLKKEQDNLIRDNLSIVRRVIDTDCKNYLVEYKKSQGLFGYSNKPGEQEAKWFKKVIACLKLSKQSWYSMMDHPERNLYDPAFAYDDVLLNEYRWTVQKVFDTVDNKNVDPTDPLPRSYEPLSVDDIEALQN